MKKKSILCLVFFFFSLTPAPFSRAEAAYDLKEMTPAVKAAIENRQARYHGLQQWKLQGVVGENNQGYVEVLENGQGAEDLGGLAPGLLKLPGAATFGDGAGKYREDVSYAV